MEEVHEQIKTTAKAIYRQYVEKGLGQKAAFKGVGIAYIQFAIREPKLFQLLFMQRSAAPMNLNEAVRAVLFGKEQDIAIITRDYHATPRQAERLFNQMWIYTYGLCVMSAAGLCAFSDGEIASLLGEMFAGMIHVIRSGGESVKLQPVPEQSAASRELRSQSPDLRR